MEILQLLLAIRRAAKALNSAKTTVVTIAEAVGYTADEVDEIWRNAAGYGWEVGATNCELLPVLGMSLDNPFSDAEKIKELLHA